MMSGGPMAAAPAAAPAEEEEPEPVVAVQTSFTLKLDKFDDSKKVALIKELKNQLEGMNLVQAKKFVESCPAVVKADIAKDDAEKLKTALEAAENILDELRKIPETTLAYVTQESYKSFFARKNFIVLTKISCIDLLFFPIFTFLYSL